MVFFQLDPIRFIQVYILQGSVGVFFLLLAYKILKRDRKRLNLIFSLGYITSAIGIFINFIYAPLTNEDIIIVLYYLTIFFMFLFGAFFLVFLLILLKSEKVFTSKKQWILIIIYAIAELCSIFIPNGVTINASTDWKPVWSWPMFIYFVSVIIILGMAPSLYYSSKIYQQFEDEQIKRKWKFFIIGICGIYTFAIVTLLANTLNIQSFRTIWSLFAFILVISSPLLIYYGVGRQIEK
jgi:hypothetical protein